MRRAAAVLLGLAAGVLAVEAFAFLALAVADGAFPTPARRAAERAAVSGEPGALVAAAGGRQPRVEVLHPYLGFVHDPDKRGALGQRADAQGLHLGDAPPAGAFVVGLFGGSVAAYLAQFGAAELRADLQALPALAGREIAIRDAALHGFKQPQQLLELAWLLSLGERFDAVVNLDGFNDIALPAAENAKQKVNPLWPRGWPSRVAAVPDPAAQRAIGRIAWLEERRERSSAWFARPPLSWSSAAHVVWRALDRAAAGELAALREGLLGMEAASGFLTSGARFDVDDAGAVQRASVDVWRRSSLAMDRLCRGLGVIYLHFLQPNQYVPGSKPMADEERTRALRPGHPYREPVERGYAELSRAGTALREEGVRFSDLTQLFAKTQEPIYADDCCHVNARGNQMLAAAIATALADALAEAPPAP